MKRAFLAIMLLVLSAEISAQNADSVMIRKIANEVLHHSTAYENLRTLTKKVGGRLSGSPQMYKAEAWAQQALKDAGADKIFLQECMVPHWVRGSKEEAWFINGSNGNKIPLDITALGNSVGTGIKGIKAQILLINTFEDLEAHKDQIRGRIVFYNYPFNPELINNFHAYRDAVPYRVQGPAKAARHGALGVIVRSMSQSADNNPHTGITRYNDSFPKIPAVAIGLRDADKLASAAKTGTVTAYFRSNAKMLADTIAHNVIAEIKGSEFPDEIITVGGHLDSWDPAEGAHDDGAGCVHSIEVLRVFKAMSYRPKRTIRIVLFANEENGSRGGAVYAETAKRKNEKHVFALESDEGGFTPRGFGFMGTVSQLNKLRGWLPLLQPYGVFEINSGGGGSDVNHLNTQLGTPVAGFEPDSQRYFDVHHARNDTFEVVNKRELELGAINIAALIYLVDKYGL